MFQRATGGERVRGENLDAVLEQVVPGGDPFRIAGANGEGDDGVGDHPLVLVGVPVLGHQPRRDEAGDVRRQREGQDVGWQPGLDGAALLAGGGKRRFKLDAGALRRVLEQGDQLFIRLARGRVGDEGQRDLLLRADPSGRRPQDGRRGGSSERLKRLPSGQFGPEGPRVIVPCVVSLPAASMAAPC
jgi:hypothetical protein